MMNKELELLYKIFELELSLPIKIEATDDSTPHIYNRHSEIIGIYRRNVKMIMLSDSKTKYILKKVKQVFNIDKLSNYAVYYIANQLFNWIQNNFPTEVVIVRLYNFDENDFIHYPKHPHN